MRILMMTANRDLKRRYASAAGDTKGLSTVQNEAQALERLYRDPFDALLIDAAQRFDALSANAYLCPDNLFLLLPARTAQPMPPSVVAAFLPSCTPETVLERIGTLSVPGRRKPYPNACVISAVLSEAGVPTHLFGFPLLKDAMQMILAHGCPTEIRMQTDIYERLSARAKRSVSVVEHAMRHAIDAAWLRADARVLERLFGYTVSADRATPSNEAFLFQLCEHIRTQREA